MYLSFFALLKGPCVPKFLYCDFLPLNENYFSNPYAKVFGYVFRKLRAIPYAGGFS